MPIIISHAFQIKSKHKRNCSCQKVDISIKPNVYTYVAVTAFIGICRFHNQLSCQNEVIILVSTTLLDCLLDLATNQCQVK